MGFGVEIRDYILKNGKGYASAEEIYENVAKPLGKRRSSISAAAKSAGIGSAGGVYYLKTADLSPLSTASPVFLAFIAGNGSMDETAVRFALGGCPIWGHGVLRIVYPPKWRKRSLSEWIDETAKNVGKNPDEIEKAIRSKLSSPSSNKAFSMTLRKRILERLKRT